MITNSFQNGFDGFEIAGRDAKKVYDCVSDGFVFCSLCAE